MDQQKLCPSPNARLSPTLFPSLSYIILLIRGTLSITSAMKGNFGELWGRPLDSSHHHSRLLVPLLFSSLLAFISSPSNQLYFLSLCRFFWFPFFAFVISLFVNKLIMILTPRFSFPTDIWVIVASSSFRGSGGDFHRLFLYLANHPIIILMRLAPVSFIPTDTHNNTLAYAKTRPRSRGFTNE